MLILPRKRVVGPGASLQPLAPWVSFNRLGGSTGTLTREGGIVQAPAALGPAWQGNGSSAGAWYPMSVLKTSASAGGFDSLAVAGILQSLGQSGDVVSLGASTNSTGGVCRLGWTTGGALSFFASDAADVSGQNTISSRTYNDGKPHVAVGLIWTDGAGNRNLRLFVDGDLAASGSSNGGFNATTYDRFAVNCVRRASTVAFAPLSSFVFDGFFAKNVTESQAQAASARLWDGFFAPTQRRIWVPGAVGGGISQAIGQATEADTAQALTVLAGQSVAIAQAVETDAARPLVAAQARTILRATETDAAQALRAAQARGIGRASETDTAQPFTTPGTQIVPIGLALEIDAAGLLAASQSRAIGRTLEADAAQSLRAAVSVPIGTAAETDAARALQALFGIAVAIGRAAEVDEARMVGASGGAAILAGVSAPPVGRQLQDARRVPSQGGRRPANTQSRNR